MRLKGQGMSLEEFHVNPICSWPGTSIWNNPVEKEMQDVKPLFAGRDAVKQH